MKEVYNEKDLSRVKKREDCICMLTGVPVNLYNEKVRYFNRAGYPYLLGGKMVKGKQLVHKGVILDKSVRGAVELKYKVLWRS